MLIPRSLCETHPELATQTKEQLIEQLFAEKKRVEHLKLQCQMAASKRQDQRVKLLGMTSALKSIKIGFRNTLETVKSNPKFTHMAEELMMHK